MIMNQATIDSVRQLYDAHQHLQKMQDELWEAIEKLTGGMSEQDMNELWSLIIKEQK